MTDQRFGVHPRRERHNAILDECEEELLESGVLDPPSIFDRLGPFGFVRHLFPRFLRSLLETGDTTQQAFAMAIIIAFMFGVVLLAPWLGKAVGGIFSGTVGTISDIFSGKPLVPG